MSRTAAAMMCAINLGECSRGLILSFAAQLISGNY
jgi:hypothetical protein